MNKEILKKVLVYAGIILLFGVIAYGFVPQVFDGKVVNQSDIASWRGMANEAIEHNAAHPEDRTAWTDSMFGGMPTTAMIDQFDGDWTKKMYYYLLKGLHPANYLFIALIGAFLLMLAMGVNGIVAVAGAIAIAFCSYNMQIIQVGHNTKMQAIAYLTWVLAGVIFTYKAALKGGTWKQWLPKTILGSVLFAFALSFQIKANHVQITYYLAIMIFVYAIALLISLCADKEKRKDLGRFFAASALLLTIGCIGIATNANKLIPTYEYTPYTMRGGSELSGSGTDHNSKGLDLEYATAWSYGIEEMPNLLIPNFNGGSSAGPLDLDSETGKLLKRAGQPNLRQTLKAMPLYWGPQPFTAGPMYMGAITIFLFMLGLFLCKGREKWWILAATVIAVLLSWGNHFMWFTKLWFDYAPFYNKFRTVSMSLVVLQVTLPLLGFYTLDRIIRERYTAKEFGKAGIAAYCLTGLFCLVCAIMPGIAGTFSAPSDSQFGDMLAGTLAADRSALLAKDAWRSFWLITIVCALLMWAFHTPKNDAVGKNGSFVRKGRMTIVAFAMIFLVWADLFSVGKRYLNKDHFVTPKDFSAQYDLRPVDEIILEDSDPDYRVLDVSVNTFNNSIPSYHHKTIGGYSPVKMQRYQDLIERYLTSEIRQFYAFLDKAETVSEIRENLPELKVTSLLNGKYIVIGGNYAPIENPYRYGNAWFVTDYVPAAGPDEEIALLGPTDLRTTAVIGEDFRWAQERFPAAPQSMENEAPDNDEVVLTHYAPNELRYSFRTGTERAAIFSEIYYPKGWKAWIEPAGAYGEVRNGRYQHTEKAQEVELFRADWILRGAVIPEGEGQLIMRFEPDSYRLGADISRASSITLILLLILSVTGMVIVWRKDRSPLKKT